MPQEKSIFITGATGFVGAHLVRHFSESGWKVTASGRSAPAPELLKRATYVQADLSSVLFPQKASVAVHAAALASDTADWKTLEQTNIIGVKRVFEATRDCRNFIFISSSSVYPPGKKLHFENESIDNQLLSPYGRSKRLAEEWLLAQDWAHRNLFILRPRAIYGSGDRVLLPRLLRLVKNGWILSPGDMRVRCSMTHVGNLCEVVKTCAGVASEGAHIYNVSDAQPYEMRTVVQKLLSEIHGIPLSFLPLPLWPLKQVARILEKTGIAQQFTPYALAAVSTDSILDIQKIRYELGHLPGRNIWDSTAAISAWVRCAGITRVQRAEADLPWIS